MRGLSLVAVSRGYPGSGAGLLYAVRGSPCCGQGLVVGHTGSVVGARRLSSAVWVVGAHRLGCFAAWNLPRPGIEPVSPALQADSYLPHQRGSPTFLLL